MASNMNINKYFEPTRFWLLLQLEFHRNKRVICITILTTLGSLFLAALLSNIIEGGQDNVGHVTNYCLAIGIGGFVITSMAFSDLAHTTRRNGYLTLPASIFEKLLSVWMLTCVVWSVMLIVLYVPYTWCVAQLTDTLFKSRAQFDFNPFNEELLGALRGYIILQGIYLIGAIQFRGYAFAKTSLTILIFMAVCGLIFYWIMADVLPFDEVCVSQMGTMEASMVYKFWLALGWLYYWAFAPLCWWIAYLSLKEQEG